MDSVEYANQAVRELMVSLEGKPLKDALIGIEKWRDKYISWSETIAIQKNCKDKLVMSIKLATRIADLTKQELESRCSIGA